MKTLITSLLILLPFLTSCFSSRVWSPVFPAGKEIMNNGPIKTERTVLLVNGWSAPKHYLVYKSPMGNARGWIEFQDWTRFAIERLESELRSRGVTISSPADNVFKVSVTHATYTEASPFQQSYADTIIRIEASDKSWGKEYKGIARAKGTNVRLDLAFFNTVETILNDNEFREAMSRRPKEKTSKDTPDKNNVMQKLEQLKQMREKGLITEEEYQTKRKEILKTF